MCLLFMAPVHAASPFWHAPSPSTLPAVVDSQADILPISISISTKISLREQQAAYAAAESVRLNQREKYSQLQARLPNSFESEQPLLIAQLGQQRQRVLLATLNVMILVYQQSAYLTEQYVPGLVRMQAKYNAVKKYRPVTSFDLRHSELSAALNSLKKHSTSISQKLSRASSSVELGQNMVEIKEDLSSFLEEIKSFTNNYRSLSHDILNR